MTTYKVLIQGYAYSLNNDVYVASPTSLYIESNGKRIIADPGTSKEKLLEAIQKHNIDVNNLDYIFLSHYHPDHFLNLRIFPTTPLIDGTTIWDDDKEMQFKDKIPGTDIGVISLPGHTGENAGLKFETETEGIVFFSPDVFWWEDGTQRTDNYDEMLNKQDPFAQDINALIQSRKYVLENADYIIPGHGSGFYNTFKK